MKKLLLLCAILTCNFAVAQHRLFCEIIGTQKFMKEQITITIDFGQEGAMKQGFFGASKQNRMVDETGKAIEFNSMVDAMNYLGELGWEFEQAYVATTPAAMGGGQNVYHWLLSKRVVDNKTGTEGIKTHRQHQAQTAPPAQPQ